MDLYLKIYGIVMLLVGLYTFMVVSLNRRHFRKFMPKELMKDGPLISVVVPARNEEHNLPRLLDSLIKQSYRNIEIIIADDQSTDRTPEIIKEYMAKDSRIRMISIDPNKPLIKNGKINALINLMDNSKGEYVLSTDADTEHHPDSVAYSYTVAKNHGLDLLSGITRENCKSYSSEVIAAAMMFTRIFIPIFLVNNNTIPGATFAIGQYMFMKRDSYYRTPGYKGVKSSIDDVGIARLFVECKLHYATASINRYVTCYMYSSMKTAFLGVEKSLGDVVIPTIGNFLPLIIAAIALLHLAVSPISAILALIFFGISPSTLLLLAGTMLLFLGWFIGCRQDGWPKSISASYGITMFMTCIMFFHSFYRNITGKGFIWKDRKVISKPSKKK